MALETNEIETQFYIGYFAINRPKYDVFFICA